MPSSPFPRDVSMSKIAPSPLPALDSAKNVSSNSTSSSNINPTNGSTSTSTSHSMSAATSRPHQVGTRQATRSRTRTRQAQPSNANGAGPSRLTASSLPRYNSEDHPLSAHKLASRDYHTFQCLGIPFHVKKRYTFLRELGIGAYGCVALARDHLLDCNVAIKKVTRVFERDVLARRALREVAVLRHIGLCDNVTALLDFDATFIEFHEIYLVLEASEADLSQIIRSGQSLSDAHLQYFVAQLLRGVRYMHAANVIHRDLKPGNLLVNADCQLKLCDFGLARAFAQRIEVKRSEADEVDSRSDNVTNSPNLERSFPESPKDTTTPSSPKGILVDEQEQQSPKRRIRTTELDFPGGPLTEYVATRWYRAPEIMLCFQKGYGQQIDMWAVGCILAELLSGKPIFAGQDYVDQIARINNVLGSPEERTIDKIGSERAKKYVESLPQMPAVPLGRLYPNASPMAVDLLSKLLLWDPNDRISAEEALMHPWLKAYHKSNRNWTPPSPFSRFKEVELLETIADFRMGLEREADEMREEMAALEQEVDEGVSSLRGARDDDDGDAETSNASDHPRDSDKDGADDVDEAHDDDLGGSAKGDESGDPHHTGSTQHLEAKRMARSTSSTADSPVPTPSSLTTSANEASPTYETDLTSASAPHSVSGSQSGKSSKSRVMDGLGLLPQQSVHDPTSAQRLALRKVKSEDRQERRALDETLANHGLLSGDAKSQLELLHSSRSKFRRRALSNAPSRTVSLPKLGSEADLRCTRAACSDDDLITMNPTRSNDLTRRSPLQREENGGVRDEAESISAWLLPAIASWATRYQIKLGVHQIPGTSFLHGSNTSREGSDSTTVGYNGPATADTVRHSPDTAQ